MLKLVQLESLCVLVPQIREKGQCGDVVDEVQELFVVFVVVEGDYRNAVVQLETERIHCVIYYHYVF